MTVRAKTDEMFEVFLAAYQASVAGIVGYVPEVRYVGVFYSTVPDKSKFYVSVEKVYVGEDQLTISNCVGQPYLRHWEQFGFLAFEVFCPRNVAGSYQKGEDIAELIKNAYRGKTTNESRIRFKKARIVSASPSEHFERLRVVVNYEFSEIG